MGSGFIIQVGGRIQEDDVLAKDELSGSNEERYVGLIKELEESMSLLFVRMAINNAYGGSWMILIYG